MVVKNKVFISLFSALEQTHCAQVACDSDLCTRSTDLSFLDQEEDEAGGQEGHAEGDAEPHQESLRGIGRAGIFRLGVGALGQRFHGGGDGVAGAVDVLCQAVEDEGDGDGQRVVRLAVVEGVGLQGPAAGVRVKLSPHNHLPIKDEGVGSKIRACKWVLSFIYLFFSWLVLFSPVNHIWLYTRANCKIQPCYSKQLATWVESEVLYVPRTIFSCNSLIMGCGCRGGGGRGGGGGGRGGRV